MHDGPCWWVFGQSSACELVTVTLLVSESGAIMVGKTNMDQFAAGLVGTRTPFGIAPNCFDPRYISMPRSLA